MKIWTNNNVHFIILYIPFVIIIVLNWLAWTHQRDISRVKCYHFPLVYFLSVNGDEHRLRGRETSQMDKSILAVGPTGLK